MNDKSDLTLDRQGLLAILDHSLRSPLNSIFHHSELLLMGLEGEISEAVRADVQTIADEAQALNTVVQRLLIWVQLEASVLTQERINIAHPIRTAIGDSQSEIDRAGKQITSNVGDKDFRVLAYEKALYQIVLALLFHFIENGESQRIYVTLQAENGSVSLNVSDDRVTGPDSPKPRFGSRTSADLLLSSILVEQMGGQLIMSQPSSGKYAIGLLFPRITESDDSIP
jgi:signal transduction histidine kinase